MFYFVNEAICNLVVIISMQEKVSILKKIIYSEFSKLKLPIFL